MATALAPTLRHPHDADARDARGSGLDRLSPSGAASALAYRLRLAQGPADLQRLQALRFEVFNLELREGLTESWATGLDQDRFDAVCQHLMVEHLGSGAVVGTYRLQTGTQAAAHHGYYCDQEFDLSPLAALRPQLLELGRACIASEHRNFTVLSLLWRGIAEVAGAEGARYLLGCSSLTSQDPAQGWAAHHLMKAQWASPELQCQPWPALACTEPADGGADPRGKPQSASTPALKLPKLLSAYLALGARIASPPAIDRSFRTIDFLTLLDLESPDMRQRRGRFGL